MGNAGRKGEGKKKITEGLVGVATKPTQPRRGWLERNFEIILAVK